MPKFLRIIALVFFILLILWVFQGIMQNPTLAGNSALISILIFGALACAFTLGGGGN
ncbi:MAG: hypothetical protein R3B93_14205 [Bacteroidia bacterium]